MGHYNNIVARGMDAINRDGFEHLMDYITHPLGTMTYYQARYRASSPVARYLWGFTWRAALTVVPVLPALYCMNRIMGVILNPLSWYNNFPKFAAMAAFTAPVAGAITYLGWPATVSTLTNIVPFATTITAFVPGAVLAAGVIALGSAFLLYGAKQLARYITSKNSEDAGQHYKRTTRKHNLEHPNDNTDRMYTAHREALREHIKLKTLLKESAHLLIPLAKTLSTFKEIDAENYIRRTEETVSRGKAMLGQFEAVMRANGKDDNENGQLKEEDHDLLTADDTARKLGSYSFWSVAVNKIDPNFTGTLPETDYSDHRKFTVGTVY